MKTNKNNEYSWRTGLKILPSVMVVNREQPPESCRQSEDASGAVPESLGIIEYAENVRTNPVKVVPVHKPQYLCTSGYRPVVTEERGRLYNVLTQSYGGVIRHAFSIDKHNDVKLVQNTVGLCKKTIVQGARVATFTTVRHDDNSLSQIKYDNGSGGYEYLGTLPSLPEFKVEQVHQPSATAQCESVAINPSVQSFRQGVRKKLVKDLEASAREGYRKALQSAASARCWTGAVAVRLGARMWDGSLIYLSAPRIIGVKEVPVENSDVNFPLTRGENGYETTEEASVSLPMYKLRITTENFTAEEVEHWSGLIRQLEVWISDQTEEVSGSGAEAFYRELPEGEVLAVRLSRYDTSRCAAELAAAPMRKAYVIPFGNKADGVVLDRVAAKKYMDVVQSVRKLMPRRAKVMSSHDGFLHLGNVEEELPEVIIPHSAGTASLPCRVMVDIRVNGKLRHIIKDGVLHGTELEPLLWYGDGRAEKMTLWYENESRIPCIAEFELESMADEDAACYAHPYGRVIKLDAISRYTTESMPEGDEKVYESFPERIVTSIKGNPLVVMSESSNVGGVVKAIVGQPNVKGSYTRHFVYLSTDNGILMLTHDMNGRYTNLRGISSLIPENEEGFAKASQSVYVIASGTVAEIRNGSVVHLVRGLTEFDRLMWYEAHQELWLLPRDKTRPALALNLWEVGDVGIPGSMRKVKIENILVQGMMPILSEEKDGNWELYALEGNMTSNLAIVWRTNKVPLPTQGFSVLRAEIDGDSEQKLNVRVEACNPESPQGSSAENVSLTECSMTHPYHGVAEIPFVSMAPSITPVLAATFRIELTGHLIRLGEVKVMERGERFGMDTPFGRMRRRALEAVG
ncbi:MAG: hypothetical protein NC201_07900 [Prevotella sp.]|nr:hypothetical protein [Bacteroides sp.]MCM1367151.1 hypothetical protein [Prevotella sp.]